MSLLVRKFAIFYGITTLYSISIKNMLNSINYILDEHFKYLKIEDFLYVNTKIGEKYKKYGKMLTKTFFWSIILAVKWCEC